jgi:Photosynthesis system II assembly factor YCF48
MNQKLPNSIIDALAREAKPAEHPSADVLAAFVERALAESEKQSVTDHLARCGECREVVFMASATVEEVVSEHQAAAAASNRPRRTWAIAWAASGVAVFLLAGGLFVWRGREKIATGPDLASKTVAEVPARTPELSRELFPVQSVPSQSGPQAAVSSPVAKSPAVAAPAMTPSNKKAQPLSAEVVVMNAAPPPTRHGNQPTTAAESSKALPQVPELAVSGAMAAQPAPRANGFVQSDTDRAQQYSSSDSISLAVNQLAASAAQAAHRNWRITPQGKLEHLTSEGWTQVLADQKQRFRVVSITGSHVWAGGDSGALFHSSDGGQHWTKVSLATREGTEIAAIDTIRFDDPLHGEIGTLSGSSYNTTDGGTTWTKQ